MRCRTIRPARRWAALYALLLGLAALVAACEHTTPPDYEPPGALPPTGDGMPRRLTFDGVGGADRSPSVSAGVLAYSRVSEDFGSRERCVALLPPEGGTLLVTLCPPPPLVPDDSVETWVEPTVSPDGARIAYVYQKSYEIAIRTTDRELHVAPIDDPANVEFRWESFVYLSGDRLADAIMKPSWRDSVTIRFLAAWDFIPKVKIAGAQRLTDTTLIPKALVDVSLVTGEATVVPGADSAVAYATAPDGGTWVVLEAQRTRLMHQAPGSSRWVEVGSFSDAVLDLTQVDGLAVAALTDSTRVEVLDPSTGARAFAGVPPGWVLRLAAVPGSRRLVAEVEQPVDQFGGPANLWLIELPP
jgi:hypothetical protein